MSKTAVDLARKYGRQMDVIEAFRRILAEKESAERERQQNDPKYKTNFFGTHIAEGMYNIPAYSEPQCVIISDSRQLQAMQWGLIPHTAKPEDAERYNKQNWFKNARAEDIFETWPYRMSIMHRRCLIPSTGFFEPHYPPGSKSSIPYFIKLSDRELFCMAGIWDAWPYPGKGGKPGGGYDLDNPDFEKYLYSYSMLTVEAQGRFRDIHNGGNNPGRMPLILSEEDEKRWLDPSLDETQVRELFKPYPDTHLEAYPVAKKFNWMNPYSPEVIRKEAKQGEMDF